MRHIVTLSKRLILASSNYSKIALGHSREAVPISERNWPATKLLVLTLWEAFKENFEIACMTLQFSFIANPRWLL